MLMAYSSAGLGTRNGRGSAAVGGLAGLAGRLFGALGSYGNDSDMEYLAGITSHGYLGERVSVASVEGLEKALKSKAASKYIKHSDLKYTFDGGESFVFGRDAVPEAVGDDELLRVFDAVSTYGSKGLRDKFEQSLYARHKLYNFDGSELEPEVVQEPSALEPKKKGFLDRILNYVKTHKTGVTLGLAGILGLAAFGVNAYAQGQAKDKRVDQLVDSGAIKGRATAAAFDDQYSYLAGEDGYNITVLKTVAPTFENNATLLRVLNGARTPDGDFWGTAGYVAEHLDTPQYMPKTALEAKCMSKLIGGVDGIAGMPKELKAYSADAKTLLYDIGIAAGGEAAAWGGVRNVAGYMLGLIRNGTITTDGLDGEELRRLMMPIKLADTDIITGWVDGRYTLERFLRNTSSDAGLNGDSPLVWQGKTLRQIKAEKGEQYETALRWGNMGYAAFEEANAAYRESIKNLPEKDDILFVYGSGIPMGVGEGRNGQYDTIAGMHFGIPAKYRIITYPGTGHMKHDDPCIWSKSLQKYVGPFIHVAELQKSYDGTPYEMNLVEYGVDGQEIKVTN